jgi:hypothetical protein
VPQPKIRLTLGDIVATGFADWIDRCRQETGSSEPDTVLSQSLPAPAWPPDLFGICAYLLQESGHYQALTPVDPSGPGAEAGLVIDAVDRESWTAAGRQWAKTGRMPSLVEELWTSLLQSLARPLHLRLEQLQPEDKVWIRACLGLVAIADEACHDLGFDEQFARPRDRTWIYSAVARIEAILRAKAEERQFENKAAYLVPNRLQSLTLDVTTDLLAVQPKSRTPQVGATTRALSHNLALLPPINKLGASWNKVPDVDTRTRRSLASGDPAAEDRDLNILLIPYPYSIPDAAFHGEIVESSVPKWGWFDVRQTWLPDDPRILTEFLIELIRKAQSQVRRADPHASRIHGVVLPELAVDWRHHEALVSAVAEDPTLDISFIVTGSSGNCDGVPGNFEITTTLTRQGAPGTEPARTSTSRPKHHRWRLDSGQVRDYSLGDRLQEDVNWWERIALTERSVNTYAFGPESHFTVLICEDLARADPVHELVRAMGPSLVFCILMDSTQIPQRWPGRHAMSLSEDPGSSVLTFTSRALIERSNAVRARKAVSGGAVEGLASVAVEPQSWSVALWRDEVSGPVQLHCPPSDHGLVLRLHGAQVKERTFDGRCNDDAFGWRYRDAFAVRLAPTNPSLVRMLNAVEKKAAPVTPSVSGGRHPRGSSGGSPGGSPARRTARRKGA